MIMPGNYAQDIQTPVIVEKTNDEEKKGLRQWRLRGVRGPEFRMLLEFAIKYTFIRSRVI